MELAGAIGEISRDTLKKDFRSINPADAKIFRSKAPAGCFPPIRQNSRAAERALNKLGVQTRTGAMVTGIDENGATVKSGDSVTTITSKTVLWAAGVQVLPQSGRCCPSALGLYAYRH